MPMIWWLESNQFEVISEFDILFRNAKDAEPITCMI